MIKAGTYGVWDGIYPVPTGWVQVNKMKTLVHGPILIMALWDQEDWPVAPTEYIQSKREDAK